MATKHDNLNAIGDRLILDPLYSPTGEKVRSTFVWFGEEAREALRTGICPYCDTNTEGMLFGGSDGRDGGFIDCPYCQVRVAWIENPFEAEEERYGG